MSTELAKRDQDAFELGKVFAESGMFPNTRKASEAIVKIIAGREFGLGPMAAMNGIHMVDGKPTLAANLIAGQIKRHPSYDYRVVRRDEDGCELEFFELYANSRDKGRSLGTMTFDKKDAERAGLLGKQNWKKYPRDMYFARCLTAGARTFCPDVLGGSPIYTAEELGADEATRTPDVPGPDIPFTHDGGAAVAEAEIADAELVTEQPAVGLEQATVTDEILNQLRQSYQASGLSEHDLCWLLVSVGVESLPEQPSSKDVGAAMRSLTVRQAFDLRELIEQRDESVPGSGESA